MSLIYKIPKVLKKCFSFLPQDIDERTRHLIVQYIAGLLLCFHRKNATNIAALYGRHKSSYTRLLNSRSFSEKGWIADIAYELLSHRIEVKPGTKMYLIIDSTFKAKRGKKMHNLKKFRVSSHSPYFFGHCFVMGIIYYEGWVIPVALKVYLSKEYCQKTHRKFHTQIDLAQQIISEFISISGVQTIVLFDSFFCADKVLQEIDHKKLDYVSVLDRNRVITSLRGNPSIDQRIKRLLKTKRAFSRTAFMHEGRKKQYFMRQETLTISKVGEVVVVFSGKKKIAKRMKALVSNLIDLSAVEISIHYSYRWFIECFFKILKQYLGFGDYQTRPVRAQVRHGNFVLLAYLTLLVFHITDSTVTSRKLSRPTSFKQLLLSFRKHVEAENLLLLERKLNSKNGVKFLKRVYKTLRKKVA